MPHANKARARRAPDSWLLMLLMWVAAGLVCSASCDSKEKKHEPASSSSQVSKTGSQEPPTRPEPSSEAEPSDTPSPREWTFEDTEVEKLPEGWSAPVGQWRVETAEQAPSGSQVLAQKASNRSPAFNVALVEDSSHADVDITVRLRARKGRIDQGGGVIWRAQDARNYYIARYNPLEDNYRVYFVQNGRRRQLKSADVELDHQAWHTLRVKMTGEHIECFLDGNKHLEVRDGTFPEAGMVGLWTKADAQTQFDNLRVLGLGRSPLDADAIGEIFDTDAKVTKDGVVRVTWSRTEVPVNIDGMRFPPSAGLTSWAGFAPADDGAMVMGDTVVFQDEVSPAMDAAFARGLEITALHNHFFFDEPKVYFMHIGGRGDAQELARGARAIWDAIRERRKAHPEPASTFGAEAPEPDGEIDAAAIGEIVGTEPSVKKDGVVKVAIPRKATMGGTEFGGSMGLASWAAFTGSDDLAAIDGDFAMTAAEVQPVLRALRQADIHVVALHNHMLNEKPAYYFTHFWGKGPAAELARGFRSALDAQREAPGDEEH